MKVKIPCPFKAKESDTTSDTFLAFQSGRMDVFFTLIDSGKISIKDAAKYTGFNLSEEEIEKMLLAWKLAQWL